MKIGVWSLPAEASAQEVARLRDGVWSLPAEASAQEVARLRDGVWSLLAEASAQEVARLRDGKVESWEVEQFMWMKPAAFSIENICRVETCIIDLKVMYC